MQIYCIHIYLIIVGLLEYNISFTLFARFPSQDPFGYIYKRHSSNLEDGHHDHDHLNSHQTGIHFVTVIYTDTIHVSLGAGNQI